MRTLPACLVCLRRVVGIMGIASSASIPCSFWIVGLSSARRLHRVVWKRQRTSRALGARYKSHCPFHSAARLDLLLFSPHAKPPFCCLLRGTSTSPGALEMAPSNPDKVLADQVR